MSTTTNVDETNFAPPSSPQSVPISLSTYDQEESTSVTLQAPVKLNLPPKPVLANRNLLESHLSTETSSSIPTQEPPLIPIKTSSTELPSYDFSPQNSHSFKKKFSIGLPLAFLLFLIALISLLMQVRFLF